MVLKSLEYHTPGTFSLQHTPALSAIRNGRNFVTNQANTTLMNTVYSASSSYSMYCTDTPTSVKIPVEDGID